MQLSGTLVLPAHCTFTVAPGENNDYNVALHVHDEALVYLNGLPLPPPAVQRQHSDPKSAYLPKEHPDKLWRPDVWRAGYEATCGQRQVLSHGDRVVIGSNHFFRLNIPRHVAQRRPGAASPTHLRGPA